MKRLKVMLAIAISIAMITGCGKAASGNNTGQSADGSTGQTATERKAETRGRIRT